MPRRTPGALLAVMSFACVAAAPAAAQAPVVNLSPSQFPGVLEGPVRIGPMTLLNGTHERYRVRVFGVLLGQRRDGGIVVHDDRRARIRAGRILEAQVERFRLVPGEARSVLARVRRVPRSGSFYGGVLFQATPRRTPGASRQQIRNVLQLTASVLLDPPARRRRVRLSPGAIRASSVAGRLRLVVAVTNRGNGYERTGGRLTVRDTRGRAAARPRLKPVRILPGATVDLPATVGARLPAGRYRVSGAVRAGARRVRVAGAMRLFGVNRVATRAARITQLRAPTAYKGEEVEVKGEFRNTGNVGYAPRAEVAVRPVRGGVPGRVALRRALDTDRAAPGKTGSIQGKLELPGRAASYQLTVRLIGAGGAGAERDVSVTPTDEPPLLTRAKDWVTDQALLIVGLLLAALAAGAFLGARYVRRLKAEARSG